MVQLSVPIDRLKLALAGHYGIEREIGSGGMATVFLAHDHKHDRSVALKVMHPELSAVMGPERFLREIRIVAKLSHPHVLALYDSGQAEDFLYYVMPLVKGESLRALLNREGTLSFENAISIANDVADALSFAHRQGVVHRDVKPENILLTEGHALVADFGIARAVSTATDEPLTRTGFPLGTPGYMSPEQAAAGGDLDARTDIYSLACVIYEMLVGNPPARWVTEPEVKAGRFLKASQAHRDLLTANPPSVEPALVRALAIDADLRFSTPDEFIAACTDTSAPRRRFDEREAQAIIHKAAELEAAEPTPVDDFSLTGVKDLAAELEIPTRHVRAAAEVMDERMAPARRVLGIPAGTHLNRRVNGEVPESEFPVLLEMIQETLGEPGRIETTLGNSLAWSTEGAGDKTQSTRVQVTPRNGSTKITIMEDRTGTIAITFGVGSVVIAALAIPAFESGITPLFPAIGILIGGGVAFVRKHFKRRRQLLTGLLDRLTLHVTGTARKSIKGEE